MEMKLKILRESVQDKGITEYAEEVLSEACSAFGHRLNVGYGLIGKASEEKYGVSLTQDVVDECAEYDGTLVLTGDEALAREVSDAMNIPVLISNHAPDIAPDGKQPGGSVLAVVQSLDEETVNEAARTVRNFALIVGTGFTAVRISGKNAAAWDGAFPSGSLLNGNNRIVQSSAPDAARLILRNPRGYGIIVLPPSTGAIFSAIAEETARSPLPVRSMYGVSSGAYFCAVRDLAETRNADILSAVLSCADFLEYSCHLFREAACIRTGVYNVTRGEGKGLHVPEDDPGAMTERICSQISLAGQLVGGV